MPLPASVSCVREFATLAFAKAYADGLNAGAEFNAQGHGTDPWRVRIEHDFCTEIWHVYIQRGSWDAEGVAVFR